MRPRTYTDDQLREAAATCASMKEVTKMLGLWEGGPTNRSLRRRADELGIVLPDRWRNSGLGRPRRAVSDAVVASTRGSDRR